VVQAREWGPGAERRNQLTGGPGREKQTIKNLKTKFKTDSNLTLSKTGLTGLRKFQIKYGCEVFETRSNFLHRNFFRFQVDFE
jgi:hypothetical protein